MTQAESILKGVFEGSKGGVYTGGTLWAHDFVFNSNSYAPAEGYFDLKEGEETKYTPQEKYWWAKCYMKYKTPRHAFYAEAQETMASS